MFPAAVYYAKIALDAPIARHFDYRIPPELIKQCKVGAWVIVPWGKGRKLGVVFAVGEPPELEPERIRDVLSVREQAPQFDETWLKLIDFVATYYFRGLGEVAINAIPKLLRTLDRKRQTDVFQKHLRSFESGLNTPIENSAPLRELPNEKLLTAQQKAAYDNLTLAASKGGFSASLLLGVTGSGKTEVYLRWINDLLTQSPDAQILLLVPEINLTPGLLAHLITSFPNEPVAVLHSGLNESARAANWLACAAGVARLIVGTRLAILTPLPHLAAIVVDEEHDPSFKQQEGVHYSARDMSLVLAQQRKIPVVLASATPSLESWRAAISARYQLLTLSNRATGATPPHIVVVPLGSEKLLKQGFTELALQAISRALSKKQQALVFINRRGYAPVIHCSSCGWLSQCENCSAYQVLHRKVRGTKGFEAATAPMPYQLICHHCAATQPPPKQCPSCGSVDLLPLGRGTQKFEEGLAELFPSARVARLDRDSAQRKGAMQKFLDAAHAGEVDILVGTQMLAKGHDFQRLSEVIVVDSDAGLFSADFRAPERLFATLMQVAGRAGRALGIQGTVTIQTRFAEHSLFEFVKRQDFAGFANTQLAERESAHLPPFSFQALLRTEAKTVEQALENLSLVRDHGLEQLSYFNESSRAHIQICDPVPMPLAKLAGRGRAQLLIESGSRPVLHQWLSHWLPLLKSLPVRWHIEIDPLEI